MSDRGISGRTMAEAVSRALRGGLKRKRGSGVGGSFSAVEGVARECRALFAKLSSCHVTGYWADRFGLGVGLIGPIPYP